MVALEEIFVFEKQISWGDIFVILLIAVGVWYSWETRRLVKENIKERRINFLKLRLGKFYQPLYKSPIFFRTNHSTFSQLINESPSNESADGKRAKDFLDTMVNYSHLACLELEPLINQFDVILRSGPENLEPIEKLGADKYEDFKNKLEEGLKKDYGTYKEELANLTEH